MQLPILYNSRINGLGLLFTQVAHKSDKKMIVNEFIVAVERSTRLLPETELKIMIQIKITC